MHWGPAVVFLPQLIVNFGNGLLLPGAISGAVSVRPQAAGTAAGIIGFSQMAIGAATPSTPACCWRTRRAACRWRC